MRVSAQRIVSVIAITAAAGVGAGLSTGAAGSAQACRTPAAGTYLTSIFDAQGNLASRSILTLAEDGTLSSIDSNQGGIPGAFNPFTQNAGEWSCTGPASLTASAISFSLPGPEGEQKQLARNDLSATVDRRTKELEGTIELTFFPFTANPFQDAGTATFGFGSRRYRWRFGPLERVHR